MGPSRTFMAMRASTHGCSTVRSMTGWSRRLRERRYASITVSKWKISRTGSPGMESRPGSPSTLPRYCVTKGTSWKGLRKGRSPSGEGYHRFTKKRDEICHRSRRSARGRTLPGYFFLWETKRVFTSSQFTRFQNPSMNFARSFL